MQVQKPDYQNSILNLVNSILHNYGAPHRYTTLPEADEILKKDYRHVVLLVLDGMGVSVLERFLPEESFLRSHFQKESPVYFRLRRLPPQQHWRVDLHRQNTDGLGGACIFRKSRTRSMYSSIRPEVAE